MLIKYHSQLSCFFKHIKLLKIHQMFELEAGVYGGIRELPSVLVHAYM